MSDDHPQGESRLPLGEQIREKSGHIHDPGSGQEARATGAVLQAQETVSGSMHSLMLDTIIKGGLGVIVATLLGGVLWMNHQEALAHKAATTQLVRTLMNHCFAAKDKAKEMSGKVDGLYDFFGIDPLTVEQELELLSHAGPDN